MVLLSLLPALGPWPISSPASRQGTPAGGEAATPLETKKLRMGFGSFYTKKHGAVYGFEMQACHFVQGWEAAYEHLAGEPWPFLLLSHCLCTSLPSKGKLT